VRSNYPQTSTKFSWGILRKITGNLLGDLKGLKSKFNEKKLLTRHAPEVEGWKFFTLLCSEDEGIWHEQC
jgi:hypothetical protein